MEEGASAANNRDGKGAVGVGKDAHERDGALLISWALQAQTDLEEHVVAVEGDEGRRAPETPHCIFSEGRSMCGELIVHGVAHRKNAAEGSGYARQLDLGGARHCQVIGSVEDVAHIHANLLMLVKSRRALAHRSS